VNVPVWAAEIADAFWSEVGAREPFPRRLLGPIAEATFLSVIFVPRPTIAAVQERICEMGIDWDLKVADRPLRACLLAGNGHGLIFVDGTDPENEQRFSIAHELAHFLRDYLSLRRRVCKRLGASALDVLDGARSPTADERIHAILSRTALGFHYHLMDRRLGARPLSGPIADAEESADRLAYELLAPADQVASMVAAVTRCPDGKMVADVLVDHFGLPEQQASHYAGLLVPRPKKVDSLLLRLKSIP
jgi:IrrE N-terminal-like domain